MALKLVRSSWLHTHTFLFLNALAHVLVTAASYPFTFNLNCNLTLCTAVFSYGIIIYLLFLIADILIARYLARRLGRLRNMSKWLVQT